MLTTRTGGFSIGFRRGWSDWQKDLDGLIAWAKANELGVIDVGNHPEDAAKVAAAGLRIGTADLKSWQGFLSADPDKRKAAADDNEAYLAEVTKSGVKNLFAVMLPEDPTKPRSENFGYMVEGLNALTVILDKYDANLAIEGWPGPGALCCTPEGYRAAFKACPSKRIGVNYDPSHLIRMGIDPIRFLNEFVDRVHHVHGKDTERFPEDTYEYGTEQPPTFGKEHGFGSMAWRYTIPGHGITPWLAVHQILEKAGYKGAICIELEDENYNGSTAGEQLGLLAGARFLSAI
jgi:sugar phosphate isomerase/epimerase